MVSSGIQNVSIIDRVRHQDVWSALCLISGAVVFYFAAVSLGLKDTSGQTVEAINQIPDIVWSNLEQKRPAAITLLQQIRSDIPQYITIPLVLVLVL